jgi:hypothetical protein
MEFPILYDMAVDRRCSVKDVADRAWVVHFKMSLSLVIRQQWYVLTSHLNGVQQL